MVLFLNEEKRKTKTKKKQTSSRAKKSLSSQKGFATPFSLLSLCTPCASAFSRPLPPVVRAFAFCSRLFPAIRNGRRDGTRCDRRVIVDAGRPPRRPRGNLSQHCSPARHLAPGCVFHSCVRWFSFRSVAATGVGKEINKRVERQEKRGGVGGALD